MKALLFVALTGLAHLRFISASITQEEFNAAVESAGAPAPPDDVYECFADVTKYLPREELAMFLAQLIYESSGFRYREEIICQTGNHCAGKYEDDVGLPGKSYYGRGFFRLTWGANYKEASEDLGLEDNLLKHPEIVASNNKLAMDVSLWYWKKYVRAALNFNMDKFGLTTKAINGALECSGGANERAANRYQIYLKVCQILHVNNRASENGCYN